MTGYDLQLHLRHRNSISNKVTEVRYCSCTKMFLDKVVNFKDFSRSNKEIKYFSRTLTEFKDFSRQPLKFRTFSRLYEPWIAYWRCVSVKKRGGWGGGGPLAGTWPKVAGSNFQTENTHLSLSVSFTIQTQGHSDKDRKLLL